MLFLSGVANIQPELFEAARIDGAGPVGEFFSITLPALRGQIAVALTLTVVAALKTFDLVYITTRGGPGTSTTLPAFEAYNRAFNTGKVGSAAAVGDRADGAHPGCHGADQKIKPTPAEWRPRRGEQLRAPVRTRQSASTTLVLVVFSADRDHPACRSGAVGGNSDRRPAGRIPDPFGHPSGQLRRGMEPGPLLQLHALQRLRHGLCRCLDRQPGHAGRVRVRPDGIPRQDRRCSTCCCSGLLLPAEAFIIPLYYNLRTVGLTDTYWALVLPQTAQSLAFGIFWMRNQFRTFPTEIMEAGRLDGATDWRLLWRIMVPPSTPAMITMCLLVSMWTWNEFLIPLIMVSSESLRTAPLGLAFFQGQHLTEYSLLAAAGMIVALPIVLLYFFLQRRFISGMLNGISSR